MPRATRWAAPKCATMCIATATGTAARTSGSIPPTEACCSSGVPPAAAVLPRGATTTETQFITRADLIRGRGDYLAALARAVNDVRAGGVPPSLWMTDNHEGAADV